MKVKIIFLICIALLITVVSGCTNPIIIESETHEPTSASPIEPTTAGEVNTESETETEVETESSSSDNEPDQIDLQKIKPNEIGQMMIVMYHGLGEKNGDYVRTPESFKADLEMLYERGYRPISMQEYISNTFDIGAGLTPIVLSFDDGSQSNFNIIDETTKAIDPNSTMGILLDFNQKHFDFKLKGIFYLNGGVAFGQSGLLTYKLNFLMDNGFEIGNHSYGHENFKNLSSDQIMTTLGKNEQAILSKVPTAKIQSLSLPFGIKPVDAASQSALTLGTYGETHYEYNSVVKVGWRPEYPAVHVKFNPLSLNRVNSGDGEFELGYWIDYFDKNPESRYISDGNPDLLTIRESDLNKIAKERVGNQELRTYVITGGSDDQN